MFKVRMIGRSLRPNFHILQRNTKGSVEKAQRKLYSDINPFDLPQVQEWDEIKSILEYILYIISK